MPSRTSRNSRDPRVFYRAGDNNVECDRSGFKRKASECRMEWNGFFTKKDKTWERRQPQDLIRGFPDRQQPSISRPGTGDVFIGPGDVTADDL